MGFHNHKLQSSFFGEVAGCRMFVPWTQEPLKECVKDFGEIFFKQGGVRGSAEQSSAGRLPSLLTGDKYWPSWPMRLGSVTRSWCAHAFPG